MLPIIIEYFFENTIQYKVLCCLIKYINIKVKKTKNKAFFFYKIDFFSIPDFFLSPN